MTKSKKLDFRPNDYVVYPAHGVGQIVSIEEQEVAGISLELFEQSYSERQLYEAALERLTREVAAVAGGDEVSAAKQVGDVLLSRAAAA